LNRKGGYIRSLGFEEDSFENPKEKKSIEKAFGWNDVREKKTKDFWCYFEK